MRTIVVTGGTDGIGGALFRHYLRAGDQVVVIGRSRAKFDSLLATAAADESSMAGRAEFVAADLSLVSDSMRVVEHLKSNYQRIDALVLAASFIRRRRHLTPEGREASWVLFFVSKYLFVTRLAGLLASCRRPVVVNTAVPGAAADAIDFDDPEMTAGFTFARANAAQRRANELLGILATDDNPELAYVTWGPARLVRTSFAGEVGRSLAVAAAVLGPLIGQDPDAAARQIIDIIGAAIPGRAAYRGGKRLPLAVGGNDAGDAARLSFMVEHDVHP